MDQEAESSSSQSRRSRRRPTPLSPYTSPSVYTLPNRSRRTRTITFALSLCLPYVYSTPLPLSTPDMTLPFSNSSMPETSFLPSSLPDIASSAIDTTVRHLSHLLVPRNHQSPILAVASVDSNGKWVIPSGYVILVQRFKPGIIVLSYVIAFVGSLCTLELLVRRTNNAGWRNRLLLTAAGICFGGVSTFAMHFVFNNALSLHHPMQDMQMYPSLYLQYDAGFTVLSLVASIAAMTMAFFIMGTDIHDWYLVPHKRRRRDEKRTRNGGDEYGRWKKTHQGGFKKGFGAESSLGMGVGALLDTASRVAKWSLVESGEKRTWTSLSQSGNGKQDKGGYWENGDGIQMKRDTALDEMEFRLGKSAVREELERRRAPTPSTIDGSVHTPSRHPGPTNIVTPQSIFNPGNRRGSLPTDQTPTGTSEMFTPGFEMTTRQMEPGDSTTALLPDPNNPWTSTDSGFEPYRRRASLPAVSPGHHVQGSLRPPVTLARIQSMPETVEAESRRHSETSRHSPNLSIKAHLGTLESESGLPSHDQHRNDTKHRHSRRAETRRAFGTMGRFLGFDVVTPTDIIKIFVTGTIAGFGVAGMHYIGQASITGMPYIAYRPQYIIGSVIIASGAVCIALYIMFIMLRPKLKHTLWSKLAVAVILAAAVCLMHFTGMRGTVYGWPREQAISRQSQLTGTNAAIVGVVTALAFGACVGCAIFFAVSSWSKQRERKRRRRVVIAAVFLDQYDRVLVSSTDGMLPMCDISSLTGDQQPGSKRSYSTSSTESSALGIDLTAGHDAFVSALKMSWSWRSGLLPNPTALTQEAVNGHLATSSLAAEIRRGSQYTLGSSVLAQDSKPVRLSIAKFLEMFGNAAGQLAVRVTGQDTGIMRLGVLYDQILTTGWVKLNNSTDTVSKGQMVFLVRRVTSSEERSDLLARHHIFADPTAVATTIHKSLSVPLEHTLPLLQDISLWCDSTAHTALRPNTLYAGIAVVQATPFDGLRILLEQSNRAQLPMRELCIFNSGSSIASTTGNEAANTLVATIEEIGEALTWLEGMNLLSVITRNMTLDETFPGGPLVGQLLTTIERAIIPMLDNMLTAEDMSHILPRLTLHPMLVPLTPGSNAKARAAGFTPPYLITFYANYDAAVNTFTDKWLPFPLFRAQNACVMAGNIASAARYDVLPTIPGKSFTPGTGSGTGDRRPSRVQFDCPPEGPNANANASAGTGSVMTNNSTITSPPLPETAPTTGLFSGLSNYSFPPRPPPITRGGSNSSIPPRSSMAKVSRFDDHSGSGVNTPLLEKDREREREVSRQGDLVGVAEWDPDWLLVLLRTKLRAEA